MNVVVRNMISGMKSASTKANCAKRKKRWFQRVCFTKFNKCDICNRIEIPSWKTSQENYVALSLCPVLHSTNMSRTQLLGYLPQPPCSAFIVTVIHLFYSSKQTAKHCMFTLFFHGFSLKIIQVLSGEGIFLIPHQTYNLYRLKFSKIVE